MILLFFLCFSPNNIQETTVCIFKCYNGSAIPPYVAFGSSVKSERDAYERAMDLLAIIGMHVDSICLDRYYSSL
jgi:hypothetical protein